MFPGESGAHASGLFCERDGSLRWCSSWTGSSDRKTAKYDLLAQTGRLFQPIAAEMLGPLNKSSVAFFSELSRKIASISGDNFTSYF